MRVKKKKRRRWQRWKLAAIHYFALNERRIGGQETEGKLQRRLAALICRFASSHEMRLKPRYNAMEYRKEGGALP